uniref:Uncharacterized protein n=1 Tax=Anser cygnoides TaxID=8845 RepID=A0A8B9EKY2_ANSCY
MVLANKYIVFLTAAVPANTVELRYTRSSQQSKQMQYHSLLLCPFPAVLQADGHQLILEEIPDWNTVELILCFSPLGGDGKLDPLCEEARKAVLNAY